MTTDNEYWNAYRRGAYYPPPGPLASVPKGFFRVEVIADDSGEWAKNGMKFQTQEEAEEYARDLSSRWFLVRKWRVVYY